MQIKQIQAFPLCYPEPNDHNNSRYIMLVRVETDNGFMEWALKLGVDEDGYASEVVPWAPAWALPSHPVYITACRTRAMSRWRSLRFIHHRFDKVNP